MTMTDPYYRTRLRKAEERLAAARERARAAAADCKWYYEQVEDLHARRLRSLTDEEVLATEESRAWLCSLPGMEPYRRKERLLARDLPAGLRVDGVDGRDEYVAQQLPCLMLCLNKGQDAAPIAVAMRAWADLWRLGRSDMPVRVMEHTLSRWQSWGSMWDLDSDELMVKGSYRGTVFQGPLEKGLEYVAAHLPLYGPDGESLDDSDY